MKISCGICNYLFSPCFISMTASIGVAAIFLWEAPILYTMFRSFGAELPWLTQFVLSNYLFVLLLPFTALLLCSVSRRRTKQFFRVMLWMLIIFTILLGALAMYLPLVKMCGTV